MGKPPVGGMPPVGTHTLPSPRSQHGQPNLGAASPRGPMLPAPTAGQMIGSGGGGGGGTGGQQQIVLPGMVRGRGGDDYGGGPGGGGRGLGQNGQVLEPINKRPRWVGVGMEFNGFR